MNWREALKKVPLLHALGRAIHERQYAREKRAGQMALARSGERLFRALTEDFAKRGWPLTPTYGTLLGLARDGAFMKHDYDLDFALVDDGSWTWPEVEAAMAALGFRKERDFFYKGEVWEIGFAAEGLGVDLFRHVEQDGRSESYWFKRYTDEVYADTAEYSPIRMDTVALLPLVPATAERPYALPADLEELLVDFYGPSWRVPDPNWVSGSGRANRPLKAERALARRAEDLPTQPAQAEEATPVAKAEAEGKDDNAPADNPIEAKDAPTDNPIEAEGEAEARQMAEDNVAQEARGSRSRLLHNTVFLYILRFSTMFFGFLTLPYLTRVLGPTHYARVGLANALMYYFYLLLDFGFILSATELVARAAKDRKLSDDERRTRLGGILTAVYSSKLLLAVVGALGLLILPSALPQYRADLPLYYLFLAAAVAESFLPDFLYRGLEDMLPITIRALATKAVSTLAIFLFLKGPETLFVLPVANGLASVVAVLGSLIDLNKRYGLRPRRIEKAEFKAQFRYSAAFFLSRIASTLYGAFNTLLLGRIAVPTTVAYYSAADRLMSVGKSALAPIADSIYPYMIGRKDFRLIRKILLWLLPPIALFCGVVFVLAEPFCSLLFGPEYAFAGPVLRGMMPGAILVLPNYLLGYPSLAALGQAKHANYSIYVAALIHVPLVAILWFNGLLSAVVLSWLLSLAVWHETLYRGIVVWYYARKERQ